MWRAAVGAERPKDVVEDAVCCDSGERGVKVGEDERCMDDDVGDEVRGKEAVVCLGVRDEV